LVAKGRNILFGRQAVDEPPKNTPNDGSEHVEHDPAIVTGSVIRSSLDQRMKFLVGTGD
jgi:hypothetical protein